METPVFGTYFPNTSPQSDAAYDESGGVNTGPFVVIAAPPSPPLFSQTVARLIVAFAATLIFAVLVMIAVLFMFPGVDAGTTTTPGVGSTQPLDSPRTCYPFGCAP